jgi:LmbE family N-acetylglucosaminyl deacetylase
VELVNAARVIEGAGTAESQWRHWLASARIPLRSVPELIPVGRRLVVIAPHPDDEVLACGGLIARHAAHGGRTLVIAVTDGEASHAEVQNGDAANGDAVQLAAARRAESSEGLRRLGARDAQVHRLGLPDGRVGEHAHDLPRMLSRVLLPSDVVVSTWRLDGHPDHEATGRAAVRACLTARCRLLEAPVWMWHWAAPADVRVPWDRLVGAALEPHTIQRKQSALAAHTTQLLARDARRGPVLGAAIVARAGRDIEYFFE